MLYALGIGMGNDPLNEKELLFVNEGYLTKKPLKVVPTFAAVCAYGASPGQIDLNRVMVVDAERDISVPQAAAGHGQASPPTPPFRRLRQGQGQGRGLQRRPW